MPFKDAVSKQDSLAVKQANKRIMKRVEMVRKRCVRTDNQAVPVTLVFKYLSQKPALNRGTISSLKITVVIKLVFIIVDTSLEGFYLVFYVFAALQAYLFKRNTYENYTEDKNCRNNKIDANRLGCLDFIEKYIEYRKNKDSASKTQNEPSFLLSDSSEIELFG